MSADWERKTIGEFCPFKYGKGLPERDRKRGDFGVFSSAGLVGSHEAAYVNSPGVVIGRKGTVGSITYSPAPFWPIDTSFYVEDQPKIRDIRFTYYLLKASGLHLMNTDSAVPGLNRENAHAVEVSVPPLAVQRTIAEFVGALDDRITLLRETNATLEGIAQALFKSWFVDFDPVRANIARRSREGGNPDAKGGSEALDSRLRENDGTVLDEATARLFPDSFEESALGLVPRGWRVQSFRETIHIIGGGTPKTSNPDFWSGDIPWFSVVDAPATSDVFVVDTEKHITEAGLNGSSTKLLPTGTTIISARGTVGRLALTGCPMTMNQSCYGLRGLAGDSYFTYFSTKRLVEQLKQRAHGSVFDTITQESFTGVLVCFPSESSIAAFEGNIEPLMLRVRENLIQAQTLATLRDTLLPRLISGKLRLNEIGYGN